MAKKSSKKTVRKSPLMTFLDYASVPLCLVAGVFIAIPFTQQLARLSPDTLLSTAAMFTVSLFSIFAVYAILIRERLFKLTRLTVYLIAAVTLISLLVILWGILRDIAGESCIGFFGVATECVTNHFLLLVLIPLNPYFLLFVALLSLASLIVQLRTPPQSAV